MRKAYAKIIGIGMFPKDMLRYDNCFPVTDADKAIVECELENVPRDENGKLIRWTVTVEKPYSRNVRFLWTIARWKSFGCACEPVKE